MARGPILFSFFVILISALLSFFFLSPIEARLLKSPRSHNDYFLDKEIEGLVSMKEKSNTTSAPGLSGERHLFKSVSTLKWTKNYGPSPGEGHKNVPAGSNH